MVSSVKRTKGPPLAAVLVAAAAGLLSPPSVGAAVQTYSSAPAAVIPDALPPGPGTPQSVSDTIDVPDSGVINDVDVRVTIQHPGHGDLFLDLTGPSGAVTVRLISTEGGPGDGFSNVTFDDEAATLPPNFVVNGTCLVDQAYQPAPDSLSAFDGLDAQGTWTLQVSDAFTSDASDCDCDGFVVGPTCPRTLDSWSLVIDFEETTNGGGEPGEYEPGCRDLMILILLILALVAILWFLFKKARP